MIKAFMFTGALVCKGLITNIFGIPMKHTPYPVRIHIDKEFPESQVVPLKNAIEIWNKAAKKELFVLEQDKTTLTQGKDSVNIIYWKLKWDNDDNMEAVTINYFGLKTITESDMEINDFWIKKGVDIQTLFIHELGHVIGFDHSMENDSVMQPTLPEHVFRHKLGKEDLNTLKCLLGE